LRFPAGTAALENCFSVGQKEEASAIRLTRFCSPILSRVGFTGLTVPGAPGRFAVNLFDENESNIDAALKRDYKDRAEQRR
jgi:hypothetical protein